MLIMQWLAHGKATFPKATENGEKCAIYGASCVSVVTWVRKSPRCTEKTNVCLHFHFPRVFHSLQAHCRFVRREPLIPLHTHTRHHQRLSRRYFEPFLLDSSQAWLNQAFSQTNINHLSNKARDRARCSRKMPYKGVDKPLLLEKYQWVLRQATLANKQKTLARGKRNGRG